jgi:hypothetical protein
MVHTYHYSSLAWYCLLADKLHTAEVYIPLVVFSRCQLKKHRPFVAFDELTRLVAFEPVALVIARRPLASDVCSHMNLTD